MGALAFPQSLVLLQSGGNGGQQGLVIDRLLEEIDSALWSAKIGSL
jgi:hypothetical protein